MNQREKTCCFTGHRNIPGSQHESITRKLTETITTLTERGVIYYGTGGALGFDTLAAQTVLNLKNRYPNIKLILVLPCLSQTRGWRAKDVGEYERIKTQADKVVYTSQQYTKGCMFKRNRHLVDNSGVCVCYLTRDSGGTAYTVDYAEKQGLEVINLASTQDSKLTH